MEVTYALGAEMLVLAGVAEEIDAARRELEKAIGTGRAAERFQQIIEAQGGNPASSTIRQFSRRPPSARSSRRRAAASSRASSRRRSAAESSRWADASRVDDRSDPAVGFVITARPGDWVETGEPMATIFARDRAGVASGRHALRSAVVIADEAEPPLPLISHRVTADGAERYRTE